MKLRENAQADAALKAMINSFNKQKEPYVGPFFYDTINEMVFGEALTLASDTKWYKSKEFDKGELEIRTGNALHKQIWSKEYHRGKDKRFQGDYKNTPRGRVFEVKGKGFVVYTGSWIKDCPEAMVDIVATFQLPEDTEFAIDSHWDLGHGWSREFDL